ncbi:MAG: DUF1059 domain-containing protein [Ignavibacteria bacterium]
MDQQKVRKKFKRKSKARVFVDCRDMPSENDCSLYISGSKKEVFKTALTHAIEEHGHKDTHELRKQLRAILKRETIKNNKIIQKGIKT